MVVGVEAMGGDVAVPAVSQGSALLSPKVAIFAAVAAAAQLGSITRAAAAACFVQGSDEQPLKHRTTTAWANWWCVTLVATAVSSRDWHV